MNKKLEKILKSATETALGAWVVSIVGLSAESTATLHSLNSREPGGWRTNIRKLFDTKTGKLIVRILKKFYVGYGHKSIGDCGSGDVCVDGCSLLAANHLEHWRLFNGQETSTRYVDVTSTDTGFVLTGNDFVDAWSRRWFEFYRQVLPATIEMLKIHNPYTGADQSGKALTEEEWEKAIKARACDICGAFLPCSTRTNVSQHMELRQFADQLKLVRKHPLDELRQIAEAIIDQLTRDHPNSFNIREDKNWAHTETVASMMFHHEPQTLIRDFVSDWRSETNIDPQQLKRWYEPVLQRPHKGEFPFDIGRLGNVNIESLIDYRSFRDIHRQRSFTFQMPIVTPEYGFEDWYLEQIPEEFRTAAQALIDEYQQGYRTCEIDDTILQYSVPMGFLVPCLVSGPLDAAVYVVELRTPTSVHWTARKWATKLGDDLERWFPDLQVHICRDPDTFCSSRGKHDIVKKEDAPSS